MERLIVYSRVLVIFFVGNLFVFGDYISLFGFWGIIFFFEARFTPYFFEWAFFLRQEKNQPIR